MLKTFIEKVKGGTSLVVQWLRIHLAMRGMCVWSLVRELGAHIHQAVTKPAYCNWRVRELQQQIPHGASKTLHAATKT